MMCKCCVWRDVGLVVNFSWFFVHWYFVWEYHDWVDRYLDVRFRGYTYVVVIGVSRCPLDDTVYFYVALYAVGVNVSAEIAWVAVFQRLCEPYLGEFGLYMVEC